MPPESDASPLEKQNCCVTPPIIAEQQSGYCVLESPDVQSAPV